MSEEEMWEKLAQELRERRLGQKKGAKTTAMSPAGSHHVVNMDFASLYPNMTVKIKYSLVRKRSIKNIFPE